jgi:hypothetical protein
MHWTKMKRGMSILAAGSALLLAAACGGGDKGPTGPGGGNGPGTDTWRLVALGRAGLPADAQLEDCTLTRFYSGQLDLTQNGGWQIKLQVHDDTGDWGYLDKGKYQENADGETVSFQSQISGLTYRGTYDGTDLAIMYDWCANGVPDVQLVFE